MDGRLVICRSIHAPINDARMAGIPKRISTDLSAFLPTSVILNRLLVKCTTPVRAMATSMGKKITKTGVRIVPSPKPEKNVSIAVANATIEIIAMSIEKPFWFLIV
jgi:hypothetical protein